MHASNGKPLAYSRELSKTDTFATLIPGSDGSVAFSFTHHVSLFINVRQ